MRVWVLDDEPLAVRRLVRLIEESGLAEVAGSSTDPGEALRAIPAAAVDALLLDIEMPELNGFEVLERLQPRPAVIFTTAYDRYAVKAFEADGVDYLLKPVTAEALARALDRVARRGASVSQYEAVVRALRTIATRPEYPSRVASRLGDRVQFVDLEHVTHFFAEGKLTYAAASGKNYVVDESIAQLETRLDPAKFHRIHRTYLVNLARVNEVHSWFGGKMVARMNDPARTELPVARDRVKGLKERLGF